MVYYQGIFYFSHSHHFFHQMKGTLLTLVLLLISSTVYAQRPDLKEIEKEILEAKSNREKVLGLSKFGDALPNARFQEILDLSDSIKGYAEASDAEFYEGASAFLEGVAYFKSKDYPKAKRFFKQSIAQLDGENEYLLYRAKNILGLVYVFEQSRDSAIYHFNEVLETVDSKNTQIVLSAHGNLGLAYRGIGEYGKAIFHIRKTLELDSNNTFNKVNGSINIGLMFADMKMYEEANEALKKSGYQDIPPQPIKSGVHNNLASNYVQLNKLDSAIYHWKASYEINKQLNRASNIYYNCIMLADAYAQLGSLAESKWYLDESMELLPGLRRPDDLFRYKPSLANYYFASNELDSAIIIYQQHLREVEIPQNRRFIGDTYYKLATIYEKMGSLDSTNKYLRLQREYDEGARRVERERFLANAKANYLMAVTEGELKEVQSENQLFNAQRLTLFIGALLLAILGAIYFRNFKKAKGSLAVKAEEAALLEKQVERQKTQIIELKSKAILEASDIVSVKADGHYLEFYTKQKEKPEIDRNRLKEVLEKLPDYFVQIHRSYIVNLKEVRIKTATQLEMKNGQVLPVSRTYKEALNQAIEKFNA